MTLSETIGPSRTAAAQGAGPARAGAWFVAAWLAGLVISPSGASSTESAADVVAHLSHHRLAELAQSLLVHGLAGVALFAFTAGVAAVCAGTTGRLVARAGAVAAALSLLQAALEVGMVLTAGHVAADRTRVMLALVERLDAAKLVALAVVLAAGAVLARRGSLPRWTGPVAAAGTPTMLLAAAGMALGSAPLTMAAAPPALVLLLVWVGGVAGAQRRAR